MKAFTIKPIKIKMTNKLLEREKFKLELQKTEKLLTQLDSLYSSFDYAKLSIASPARILSWSTREIFVNLGNRLEPKITKQIIGEVTNNETVKFTNFLPVAGGLFCEKIFGPLKTGVCACGTKYEKIGFGLACPRCYVEFTESRVRRYRMGTFSLFVPVTHIWFLRRRPSYIEQILEIPRKALESTLYYKDLYQSFEFSKFSSKEKNLLYPIYYYSQTAKSHPQLCVDFCFFSSSLAKYRREHLKEFKAFLVASKKKILSYENKLDTLNSKFLEKGQNNFEQFLKRRVPNLKKKSGNLLRQIERLLSILNLYERSRPAYYNTKNFDDKIIQDFEEFYKFLTKKKTGFLSQFSKQNLFKIFNRATRIQNKVFSNSPKALLKEDYYEKLGKSILTDYYIQKYSGKYRKRYNSEIIYSLLEDINLKDEISLLRDKLSLFGSKKTEHNRVTKRLRILESFLATSTNPSSMMLTHLPILPPTLRPLQELENGKLISADLNEIYRLIILRTRRIFTYNMFGARNDDFSMFRSQIAKSVQEAVDCLIDNARMPKQRQILLNNRPLRTLTEILEGKEGRFRQTLLGKRVDYSGRSVIVVGPELKMNQCGLPFEIAKTLFEPFLISLLLELKVALEQKKNKEGLAPLNLEIYKGFSYRKFLKLLIEKNKPIIWSLLFQLSQRYSILLNRAPTLHKFGIQAFDPLIILGDAIQLHPLVCAGFNADFDGDQMAIHLPLYSASQLEIKSFLKTSANIFSPANGEVIVKPSQDIVIGAYYLTYMQEKDPSSKPKIFASKQEILLALGNKKVNLQTPIFIRYDISKFSYYIDKNELSILDTSFILWKAGVKILKILTNSAINRRVYLLTSLGVLVGNLINENKYILSDCYFETTPGRVLFNLGVSTYQKEL